MFGGDLYGVANLYHSAARCQLPGWSVVREQRSSGQWVRPQCAQAQPLDWLYQEDYGVRDAEDGRVRPDAKRERDDDERSEVSFFLTFGDSPR